MSDSHIDPTDPNKPESFEPFEAIEPSESLGFTDPDAEPERIELADPESEPQRIELSDADPEPERIDFAEPAQEPERIELADPAPAPSAPIAGAPANPFEVEAPAAPAAEVQAPAEAPAASIDFGDFDAHRQQQAQGVFGEDPDAADPQPMTGNRPAEGAQQKLPGEVLTESSFSGSETAGDFLGLDLEFTTPIPTPEAGVMDPASQAAPHGGELELSAAPSTESAPADYDAEYDLEGPTHIMHVDDEVDGSEEYLPHEVDDELEDEFAYDEEDEEGDFFGEEDAQAGSSRKGLLVGAFAAGLVAVVGVVVAPRFLETDSAGPIEVASNPAPPAPAPVESASSADPAGPETLADPADPMADPITSTEPDTGFEPGGEFLTAEPVESFLAPGPESGGEAMPENGFAEDLLGGLTEGPAPDPVAVEPRTPVSIASSDAYPNFDEGFEWISEDKLDMVWRGTEIPLEAISAPAKTVMPRVGDVRVHTTSGEMIDGRLFAVGHNRVWVDIEGGRVGLDGDTVERFERLDTEQVSSGSGPLVGARVRVNVPGGALYGRVMSQEEANLTLVTPDGARVRVLDADVETLGSGRAVVVQR